VLAEVERALAGATNYACEYRFRRSDDSYAYVLSRGYVLRDDRGRAVRMVGAMDDLTDRRRVEEALRASNELLRAVTEGMTDAVYVKDLSGRYLMINSAGARFLGRPVEEVLGRRDDDLFPPEAAAVVVEGDRRTLAAGRVFAYEEEVTAAGINWIFQSTKGPYRDRHGNVVGLVGISRDVTAQRRAEGELRESEERFRVATRATREAIWDCDLLKGRVWRSDAFQDLFGYAAADITPTLEWWAERVHPDDREQVAFLVPNVVAAGSRELACEYRFRRADGTYARVLDRGFVMVNAAERPVRVIGSMLDVTERHREAELRDHLLRQVISAEEEARRRLARDLHDGLGQTMSALLPRLRLLEDAATPEHVRDQVLALQRVVEAAAQELRLLARGLHPAVLDELGLVAALERCCVDYTQAHGVRAEVFATGPESGRLPPSVETALYRVAQEALSNVARHAAAHSVAVVVQRHPGSVQMIVEDDGRGFDPAAPRPADAGPRLGLIDMRERAALLGGTFVVESRPGAGTTVCVRVPL
jgi:PAS domain S-box-containing protein